MADLHEPLQTAVIVPWRDVKVGDVVLADGEWATARDVWIGEDHVALLLRVDGAGDRKPNPYDTSKHPESLTAVRRETAGHPDDDRARLEAGAAHLGRQVDRLTELMISAVKAADTRGGDKAGMTMIRDYVAELLRECDHEEDGRG